LDNTDWFSAATSGNYTYFQKEANGNQDTYIQFDVVTHYKDNDKFYEVFNFFCILGVALLLTLVIFIVKLKRLKSRFKKLMEEKSEFK